MLGRDPWVAESEPILTPAFTLDAADGLLHFSAALKIPLGRDGRLFLPQVIENLGLRWRADQIELRGTGFLPDGRSEFLAVDLEPANRPEHRFIRLLIAADADQDGMPDDWETALGLNPSDPFDSMGDADEDGDSNLAEFLHGTDPFHAADNTRRDEIPRAPRNAVVSNNADNTRDVDWEDVSDNEQFFAVYDTNSGGVTVELGRVGPNQTRFRIPNTTTAISVRSGNGAGLSAATAAADPGAASNARAPGLYDFKKALTTPKIVELRRLDLNRVNVTWTCAMPGFTPLGLQHVNLVILRQASDGDWQRIRTQLWATGGTFVDNADIATIWRYSAITEYASSPPSAYDAGSDAAPVRELDYGPATYGILGYRGGLPSHSWSPPGHDLTGSAPRDDWFRIIADSFNGQSPSFIPTTPALPGGQDAPLLFFMQGNRYFPTGTTEHTELSAEGYVIRGKQFNIQALARVTPLYTGCQLELVPLASTPQPQPKGTIGSGSSLKDKYELASTEVECLGTLFKAPVEFGFDDATYFSCQHLPAGGGASSERRVKLHLKGSGTTPTLSKFGPFALGSQIGDGDAIDFGLTTSNAAVDESGIVDESTTHRKLRVVTVPPKNWTIGLYAVNIIDRAGEPHTAPSPPPAAALQAALNKIYGDQANITFLVTLKLPIQLNFGQFTPPEMTYPPTYANVNGQPHPVSQAMWNAIGSPVPDLALFWVADFTDTDTLAKAFGIPSRGAVIGPNAWPDLTKPPNAIAHELGHCLRLQHCWRPNSESAQTKIADSEGLRLMGYRSGVLLRSKEIVKIHEWDPANINPLGPPTQ